MIRLCTIACVIFVATWPGGSVLAGPDIVENDTGDAGSLPGSAKVVAGMGPLNSIQGQLEGNPMPLGIDFEDMYLVKIADPLKFSATTFNSQTNFNTQLWIFDINGLGVLANDDGPIGMSSTIDGPANDGTGVAITVPGLYYIAITGFNNDAVDSFGNLIFNQASAREISGPDGPGGRNPIAGWTGNGQVGNYVILFTGVEFVACVPTVSQWGLVVMGLMFLTAATVVFKGGRVGVRTGRA